MMDKSIFWMVKDMYIKNYVMFEEWSVSLLVRGYECNSKRLKKWNFFFVGWK